MYRCVGEGGRVFYTDEEGRCPGAVTHQPAGSVQTVPDSVGGSRRSSAPARAAGAGQTGDSFEAMWRRKRGQAEADLEELGRVRTRLESMTRGCHRGAKWMKKDDAGLKQYVPCSEIEAKLAQLLEREGELRRYLDAGLDRECRQAGCLPGWVR